MSRRPTAISLRSMNSSFSLHCIPTKVNFEEGHKTNVESESKSIKATNGNLIRHTKVREAQNFLIRFSDKHFHFVLILPPPQLWLTANIPAVVEKAMAHLWFAWDYSVASKHRWLRDNLNVNAERHLMPEVLPAHF